MSEMLIADLKRNVNKTVVVTTKDGWAFRGVLVGFDEEFVKLKEVYETKTSDMVPGEQYRWVPTRLVLDPPAEQPSVIELVESLIRLENVSRLWFT